LHRCPGAEERARARRDVVDHERHEDAINTAQVVDRPANLLRRDRRGERSHVVDRDGRGRHDRQGHVARRLGAANHITALRAEFDRHDTRWRRRSCDEDADGYDTRQCLQDAHAHRLRGCSVTIGEPTGLRCA
jgi:hypothetical protein